VLESMIVQYSARSVFQTRVPNLILDIIIASKYKVLILLRQCREIVGLEVVGWVGPTERRL
jgi:hypothetical protein